jgi:WD40 repeat protein
MQHESTVISAVFSPNGRTVATVSGDFNKSTVRFWDARSGKPLIPLSKHQPFVVDVAFSPDGGSVLTGSWDGTVQFWDARNGKSLAPPLQLQDSLRTLAFHPSGKTFFVATSHWLNTYSWDGKKAGLQGSQLLHGFWKNGFRFPSDCESCLQAVLGDTGNSFHLETLRLDEPADPPIDGDPRKLLEKWKGRLGMKFDDQMRPVSAEDFPVVPTAALGDGRRLLWARPR